MVGASLGVAGKAAIAKFLYGSDYLDWGTEADKASASDMQEYANAMGIGATALLAGAFTTKQLWNLYTFLYYKCDNAWKTQQAANSWGNRLWGFKTAGNRRIKSKGNRKTKKRN
jgi:hypothetical protein